MSYRHFGFKKKIESIPTPSFTLIIVIWIAFFMIAVPLILSLVTK